MTSVDRCAGGRVRYGPLGAQSDIPGGVSFKSVELQSDTKVVLEGFIPGNDIDAADKRASAEMGRKNAPQRAVQVFRPPVKLTVYDLKLRLPHDHLGRPQVIRKVDSRYPDLETSGLSARDIPHGTIQNVKSGGIGLRGKVDATGRDEEAG